MNAIVPFGVRESVFTFSGIMTPYLNCFIKKVLFLKLLQNWCGMYE
jgi:hypothetical protein